ncbi:MAG: hypothetical protein HFI39_09245 [Lachnospiraceae bacterium]|nr:hypothetical protein [Lachnospiraceae bacterium]
MTEQEREQKKNRLRSRMLVTGTEENDDYELEQLEEPEEDDRYEHRLFWHRTRKMIFTLLPAALIVGVLVYFYIDNQNKQYTLYEAQWSKEIEGNSYATYTPYATNVLKCSQDGASYINSLGETVWTQAYEMRSPLVATNGSYAAIADQEGRSIYICDETGCQGMVNTTLPVLGITIAGQGMVAALLDDGDVSYINFFDKAGARLDIELKFWMGGEGFPMSMSLSPSGTQLMLSCVYAEAGTMQNKIAFYNFSEMGELVEEKMVGAFPIGNTICLQVAFLSDSRACAFLDNGVKFFSMENLSPKSPLLPEEGETHLYEQEIRSVFYGSGHVGVITDSAEQMAPYHLYVYDALGRLVFEKGIGFAYTAASFSPYGTCLYNQSECVLYNYNGQLRYAGALGGNIDMLTSQSQSSVIRIGDQRATQLVLK